MWHAWETRENCTWFGWDSPKERDHSDDRGVDGRMGSELMLWLRIGTGGGML
jgi:hypothetical protein